MTNKRRPKSNKTEYRMVKALDDLAEFERYQEDVLPILRKAIAEGWSPEKIYAHPKVQAMVAARNVTIGLMDKDPSKALSALKDIQDRSLGKATDRREVTHKLEKLKDEELDALLESQLAELAPDDDLVN